jgi:hypothetical protein
MCVELEAAMMTAPRRRDGGTDPPHAFLGDATLVISPRDGTPQAPRDFGAVGAALAATVGFPSGPLRAHDPTFPAGDPKRRARAEWFQS